MNAAPFASTPAAPWASQAAAPWGGGPSVDPRFARRQPMANQNPMANYSQLLGQLSGGYGLQQLPMPGMQQSFQQRPSQQQSQGYWGLMGALGGGYGGNRNVMFKQPQRRQLPAWGSGPMPQQGAMQDSVADQYGNFSLTANPYRR